MGASATYNVAAMQKDLGSESCRLTTYSANYATSISDILCMRLPLCCSWCA